MQREFELRPYLINHQALPGERSWVKIFTYEPAEEEVLATRGQMYAVLSVGSAVSLDFAPIMQLIMEALHKNYFEKTEGTILQALEVALDGIHKQLILLAAEDKRLSSGFSFNLLVAVSWGTTLYFGQLGASRAALWRKGVLYDIDEGEQKTTGLYLSSGQVKAGDRILLATQELVEGMSREGLTVCLGEEEGGLVVGVEGKLDGGDRSKQSGIVLVVDIRQVPTVEEEGLRIASSDGVKIKRQRAKGKSVSDRLKDLWAWRVVGVPGVAVVVMAVAIGGLVGSLWWQKPAVPMEANNAALVAMRSAVEKQVSDAETVGAVNPDRAYDLLVEARGWLDEGLERYSSDEQLGRLSRRLEQVKGQLLKSQDLQVSRLAVVEVKPSLKKLVVGDGLVAVLDSQKQRLALVEAESGKVSYSAASNRFATTALLAMTNRGMLLTEAGQVYGVSRSGAIGSGRSLVGMTQVEALTGYASNGYVVSRAGEVVRVAMGSEGVGAVSSYFKEPLKGEDYVDIAVDGSVYLLRQNGAIEAYRNQDRQELVLERQRLLTHPESLLTTADGKWLMVLQAGGLWLWNKEGKYVGVRVLGEGRMIEAVGVDEGMETVYILSNNGVYKGKL